MEKIASFKIDHKLLKQGIYVSRIDRVNDTDITTYDIRVIEPSKACDEEIPWLGPAFHTIEHWGATYFRSEKCSFSKDVIYFGPMGCLTGFYLILKGSHSIHDVWHETFCMFTHITATSIIPGNSAEECGRYTYHNLDNAKKIAKDFMTVLNEGATLERTTYPVGRVLFLCAMQQEADMLYKVLSSNIDAYVSITGIGKVNAAVKAEKEITRYNPNYVVSFGFAGGLDNLMLKGATIIDATDVFYHDVWCGEPNKPGQVQGYPQKFKCAVRPEITQIVLDTIKDKPVRAIDYGSVATGDSFVTSRDEVKRINAIDPTAKCVDMEAAAIAQVCYNKKIPFMAFKIISDVVGSENQVKDYNETLKAK